MWYRWTLIPIGGSYEYQLNYKMQDKKKLIESMENLISHVCTSRKNQQQIFDTLSLPDFRKIISNLEDPNETLRKTTLSLISSLLHDNLPLQKRFCDFLSLPSYPGKIVLTNRFPKAILEDQQMLMDSIRLLKKPAEESHEKGLYWYIDCHSKPVVINMGRKNSYVIDPLQCIVGIWVDSNFNEPANQTPAKKYHMIERKKESRNPSNTKVRLNKSSITQELAEGRMDRSMTNNFMQHSMRPPNSELPERTFQPETKIVNAMDYRRYIQTEKKNSYSSHGQDYSFTYIKPSMMSSLIPNSSTRISQGSREGPKLIWEGKK